MTSLISTIAVILHTTHDSAVTIPNVNPHFMVTNLLKQQILCMIMVPITISTIAHLSARVFGDLFCLASCNMATSIAELDRQLLSHLQQALRSGGLLAKRGQLHRSFSQHQAVRGIRLSIDVYPLLFLGKSVSSSPSAMSSPIPLYAACTNDYSCN